MPTAETHGAAFRITTFFFPFYEIAQTCEAKGKVSRGGARLVLAPEAKVHRARSRGVPPLSSLADPTRPLLGARGAGGAVQKWATWHPLRSGWDTRDPRGKARAKRVRDIGSKVHERPFSALRWCGLSRPLPLKVRRGRERAPGGGRCNVTVVVARAPPPPPADTQHRAPYVQRFPAFQYTATPTPHAITP